MAGPLYKGVAIPIFTVGPNWDEAPSLRVMNQCVISEALDTSEDREDKLPRPLYGIKFSAMPLSAKEQGYIRKFRELAKAMPVGMPVWMMKCKMTSNANIGASVIQFDDDMDTLLPVLAEYALIWSRFDYWEVVKIASKTSTSITTVDPVTKAWVAAEHESPYVIPLLFGSLVRSPEHQVNDEIDELSVDFEERAPVTLATTEGVTIGPETFVDDSVHYYSAHFSRVGVAGNGFTIPAVWGGNISTDYTIPAALAFSILGYFMIYDRHGGYMMSNWIGGNNEQFGIGYIEPQAPGPGPDGDCFYAFLRDQNMDDWVAYQPVGWPQPELNKWYLLGIIVPAGTVLAPAAYAPELFVGSPDGVGHFYPMFSETSGAFHGIKAGGANLLIGSRSAPSYSFDGRIDQLGVWLGRELSSDDIVQLWAANGARYPSLTTAQKVNLRAYWEFDTEDHLATALLVTPQYQYLDRLGYSSHVPVGLPPWHAIPFDASGAGVTVVPFPDRKSPVPIFGDY